MRVLILCTGNSCRSQMAAAFVQRLRPNWEVHSAGTFPADDVHPLAIQVMSAHGSGLRGEGDPIISAGTWFYACRAAQTESHFAVVI